MAKAKREEPVQEAIEGMEDVRYTDLDRACTRLGNIRRDKNELIQDEQAAMANVLKLLKAHERTSYKHKGVEVVLVPGDEKVRVRVDKAGGEQDAEQKPKTAKGEGVH